MATSSTDAYDNNKAASHEELLEGSVYPVCSVSTDKNVFWTPEVPSNSTSPESETNCDAEEESIKRRIYEMKRQFHNGRFLVLRNLPKDTTEKDIRNILTDHFVHSVQIQNHVARVLLAEPELLENWSLTKYTFHGKEIQIQPGATENILCVARLPENFSEEEFAALASMHGRISFSFLMRSEKTGDSKDYGFVSYANKDVAQQAKNALHGKELQDRTLVCEWLDAKLATVSSLHSTCLYVDRLPKDYTNMGEFRSIFSKYGTPIYSQIAIYQGVLQNWGLVEFTDPQEVEQTRNNLNNFQINGTPIRVDYWIPGIHAVNIYMKLLEEKSSTKKEVLLPDLPSDKVFLQLQNLSKHNPSFAKSLQNIIQTQIQSLQEKGKLPNTNVPTSAPISQMIGLQRPQFLPQSQSSLASFMNQGPHPEQPLNKNAQAALVLILAAQLQQQKGSGNLLSNPQVLRALQTLVSQGDPNQCTQSSGSSNVSLSSNLKANFRSGYFKSSSQQRSSKAPLLPTPEGETPQHRSSPDVSSTQLPDLDTNLGSFVEGILNSRTDCTIAPESDASLSNMLTNSNDLQQLLRSLNSDNGLASSPPLSSSALPIVSTNSLTSLTSQAPPLLQNHGTLYEHPEQFMLMHSEDVRADPYITMSHLASPHPSAPLLLPAHLQGPRPSSLAQWQSGTIFPSLISPQLPTPRLYSSVYLPTISATGHPVIPSQPVMPPPMHGYSTPIRKKRKSCHFLPSPEASPENGYVGQHSQGLGGHYPESYLHKKKTKVNGS